MKNKILVMGKGYIGEKLANAYSADVSTRKIVNYSDAESEIDEKKPDCVINCIGFTGAKNVDGCEEDKERTLFSNTFVPVILSEVCMRRKIKLVHISSGCIFNYDYEHDTPVIEEKVPDYFDLFYSRSKIYAERALEVLPEKYGILIARIRIPLDNQPNPRNILTKLLGFEKVIDSVNSVSYLPDMVEALRHLIKIDAKGIYNVVNSGGLRYSDLLEVYKKHVPGFNYKVMDYKKLPMQRTNLVMSTKKLERSGFAVRPINEVLEECVKTYIKY